MLSSIQILKHVFVHFEVTAHEKEANGLVRINYNLSANQLKTEDTKMLWEVTLNLNFNQTEEENAEPLGYEGRAVIKGIFMIHPDFAKDKVESLARMNGGAILMSAIREAILNQTLRSIHGPIELPLIDARAFLPSDNEEAELIP